MMKYMGMVGNTSDNPFGIEVVNIVVTFDMNLSDKIDLNKILEQIPDAKYDHKRFPGIILKFENPKCTLLIFSTGKVVCTGLKTHDTIQSAILLLKQNMELCGINVRDISYTVQNTVATANFNRRVDLDLATMQLDQTLYEPETFPGLTYRMDDSKSVFLVFSTGKIVCTGIKDVRQTPTAVNNLYKILNDEELFVGGAVINTNTELVNDVEEDNFDDEEDEDDE